MRYSIDTSALIDGWNRYYPPEIFPQVWQRIEELVEQEIIIASEEVLFELEKKDDALYGWVKRRERMLVPTNDQIQLAVAEILRDHKKLIDERRSRSGADPFVIAVARIQGCAVITGEKPTGSPTRPKIPDVCEALSISWLNLLQLFREMGWVFR